MTNLKNLKLLDMWGNNFSQGLPDVFASMEVLQKLNIGSGQLTSLPDRSA